MVSLSTLDHFRDPEDLAASLRQLGRIVRPGGLLLLTLDNPTNPLVALRNALPFGLLNRLGLSPYFVGATAGPAAGECWTRPGSPCWKPERACTVRVGWRCPCAGSSTAWPAHLARAWLGCLDAMERLAELPTHLLTGYFLAVMARKR